jgi:hypothetical protein
MTWAPCYRNRTGGFTPRVARSDNKYRVLAGLRCAAYIFDGPAAQSRVQTLLLCRKQGFLLGPLRLRRLRPSHGRLWKQHRLPFAPRTSAAVIAAVTSASTQTTHADASRTAVATKFLPFGHRVKLGSAGGIGAGLCTHARECNGASLPRQALSSWKSGKGENFERAQKQKRRNQQLLIEAAEETASSCCCSKP